MLHGFMKFESFHLNEHLGFHQENSSLMKVCRQGFVESVVEFLDYPSVVVDSAI